MDNNLKRMIILDNYENPVNKGLVDDNSYTKEIKNNSSCIGKTKEEAIKIIDNYNKMINEEEYDKDLLNELEVYDEIYKQPARKKCATLGINGIKDLLEK